MLTLVSILVIITGDAEQQLLEMSTFKLTVPGKSSQWDPWKSLADDLSGRYIFIKPWKTEVTKDQKKSESVASV